MKIKKGIIIALLCSSVAVSLVGCGNSNTSNPQTEKKLEQKKDTMIKKDEGTYSLISEKNLNQTKVEGPIKFTIHSAKIMNFKPDEAFKNMYKDKDELTYIELNVTLENTSKSKVTVMPATAKAILDNKTQIDADALKTDTSIGDIAGNAKIDTKICFYIDAKYLKHFKMIVDAPIDTEHYEQQYKNIEFDINL